MHTLTHGLARFFCVAALVCASIAVASGEDKTAREIEKLTRETAKAREAFIAKDPGLKTIFESAKGYAVFPRIGKGGFIFAGAHGTGLVYEKGELVGRATITQGTVGAQIGGQIYREVIFFETEDTLLAFKQSKVELNAQVTAVVAAEGASRDARYSEGVMVFTDPIKGLMAEASVGGQKFRFIPLEN